MTTTLPALDQCNSAPSWRLHGNDVGVSRIEEFKIAMAKEEPFGATMETTAPPVPKVYTEPEVRLLRCIDANKSEAICCSLWQAMYTAEEMLNVVSVGPPTVRLRAE